MLETAKTALVVEDEPLVLAVFQAVLQRYGFIVLPAETGEVALRFTNSRRLRIDLVVADVALPGASGTEVVLQIRTSRPHIPVLFSSGTQPDWWNTNDRRNIAELSKDSYAFLQKPFTARTLMDSIEELLSRKASLQAA